MMPRPSPIRAALTCLTLGWGTIIAPVQADDAPTTIDTVLDQHILPGFQALESQAKTLATEALRDCSITSPPLVQAYHDTFDAWINISHLRFGPAEVENRAFALAFWPDSRGATPKNLARMIQNSDPALTDPVAFRNASVAVRGLYALEFMLFDPDFSDLGVAPDRCMMIRAITRDISENAQAMAAEWRDSHAGLLRKAGENQTYQSEAEALRQLFTALITGLEFTGETRLGRPMGSYDRPRPLRAEARRSGRSLRHVILSLTATREMAHLMSGGDARIDAAFAQVLTRAEALKDPVFAQVVTPKGRFDVEVLQGEITQIRSLLTEQLGASIGVAAGFNALDGD